MMERIALTPERAEAQATQFEDPDFARAFHPLGEWERLELNGHFVWFEHKSGVRIGLRGRNGRWTAYRGGCPLRTAARARTFATPSRALEEASREGWLP